MEQFDVVIIGAGAAGMMCAVEAGRRGRRVLLLDHNRVPGEKIRISGGGRCNFTNLHCAPEAFVSENPKFAISALSRFTQWDFLAFIDNHKISWHEKTLGQLFCDGSAKEIIAMLLGELEQAKVTISLGQGVETVCKTDTGFELSLGSGRVSTASLVVATGGKSIPKMGASGFGYDLARQFGIDLVAARPGLVPLTFAPQELSVLKPLAGLSVEARVSCNGASFQEGLLFTHRGLSGPSILQISSYWREGDAILVDLLPTQDGAAFLAARKRDKGGQMPATVLAEILPKRLAALVATVVPRDKRMADLTESEMNALSGHLHRWSLRPVGSEGYRTAEVTLGGVSTDALNARTMEAKTVSGLYFIGEVVDVTGWLGGYNFQWAWSSGWAAGQVA